jgi:poly(3-hydroxybutyrate) depolymerase
LITKFSYWKPAKVNHPKAVVVLVPPSQSDGRDWVNDPKWQAFAEHEELGLLGCFMQDDIPEGLVEDYCNVRVTGSGRELIHFLELQFKDERIPPLLLFGYSAGGQFNYEFACCYPHLVKAFVVNKGGIYYTLLAPGETRALPALFFVGRRDAKFRQGSIDGIFGVNKVVGCKWRLIEEDTRHEMGVSETASRLFFQQVLNPPKVGKG